MLQGGEGNLNVRDSDLRVGATTEGIEASSGFQTNRYT